GDRISVQAHGTSCRSAHRKRGAQQPQKLLALANWISADVRAFNVFSYVTLRAVVSAMTALIISYVVGPGMIRKLTLYKIGQAVRDDGPPTHLIKAGTPTMGGALILV